MNSSHPFIANRTQNDTCNEMFEDNCKDSDDKQWPASRILQVIVNAVLIVVAIVCNVIVLYAVHVTSKKEQLASRFLQLTKHLCIASLTIACLSLPINTLWAITQQWYVGQFGCKLFMTVRPIGFYSTAFLIEGLAVTRYH